MRLRCLTVGLCLLSSPAFAEVHRVKAGGDLQAALDAARAGDEIRLEPGATFSGNFVLPVFDGDTPITLRSDLADDSVPGSQQRVTPAAAARFAKVASPSNMPALRTAPGAHHWRVAYLEFANNKDGAGDIITIGDGSSAQSQLAQVPFEIVLDHLYVHGDPAVGQKRGIALNGRAVTISNSHISDIKAVGADTQAIAGWNGPGPFRIENNYLEAAGECVLFGGADPAIPDLIPTDIVVRGNHITRPMDWRGSKWQVKNLFELKNARHVRVEWNLIENNWLAAQPGYAVLFTPRNQEGRCPWCRIEDVVFAHNVVRNVSAGINILGHDAPQGSPTTRGVRVEENLFTGVTSTLGGNGWIALVGEGPQDVVIDHNTFEFDGTTVLYVYGKAKLTGFQFTNNASPHGTYGINGAGASTGTLTLQTFFTNPVVKGNWLSGGASGRYPAGNRFDAPFDSTAAGTTGADLAALRRVIDGVKRGVSSGAATSSAK
jgi:hypothetical protein